MQYIHRLLPPLHSNEARQTMFKKNEKNRQRKKRKRRKRLKEKKRTRQKAATTERGRWRREPVLYAPARPLLCESSHYRPHARLIMQGKKGEKKSIHKQQ